MSETKHTPGPWTLGPDVRSQGNLVYRQVLAGPKRLCAVSVYGAKGKVLDPTFTEEEVQANARLIAAAPAMADALKRMLIDKTFEAHEQAEAALRAAGL